MARASKPAIEVGRLCMYSIGLVWEGAVACPRSMELSRGCPSGEFVGSSERSNECVSQREHLEIGGHVDWTGYYTEPCRSNLSMGPLEGRTADETDPTLMKQCRDNFTTGF